MKTHLACTYLSGLLLAAPFLHTGTADTPAVPNLIPEARKVLGYFEQVYGKKILAGQNGWSNAHDVHKISGKLVLVER